MPTAHHTRPAPAASLSPATTTLLESEKQRAEASIAWLNDALRHDPAATPQERFNHAVDQTFEGARLALKHTQERVHDWREQAQLFERSTLSALGVSPDQITSWQKQWLETQQQAFSPSSGWSQRWWDQTREQITTAAQNAAHAVAPHGRAR